MTKKILIGSISILFLVCFSGNAMAFLDDNSTNASANAGASAGVDNINAPNNSPNATVNNYGPKETKVNTLGYRGFALPADIPIPSNGPAYFGVTTPGPQFQSVRTILTYQNTFNVEALEAMAKDNDAKLIINPVLPAPGGIDISNDIKILIAKPESGTTPILVGYITIRSDAKNDVSVGVMAKAALEARKMGGNAIHITAEGVNRKLKSFGWGIGFANTTATISSSEHTGTVSSGGFGISGGEAGYVDYPWLQIFVLKMD